MDPLSNDYKSLENPNHSHVLLSIKEDKTVKPSLKYIKEDKTESISNQIQLINQLWYSEDHSEILDELRRFSESFRTIKDNYIPESITDIIEVIFDIIDLYFTKDVPSHVLPDKYKQNIMIVCLKILVNISSHTNLISLIPPTIFDLCCSHFLEHKINPAIPDKNNIFILCPECLRILVNLTSNQDSCPEVAVRLTLNDIQQFYFNQNQILTYHLYQDMISKQQKQCLIIFYNILNNSDLENCDFPIDQVLEFLHSTIDLSQDTNQIKWIIKIIFLLVQNQKAAFKIMRDNFYIIFVNSCLDRNILKNIFIKDQSIIEIQIKALQIISIFLNIENYNCCIVIESIIELANNQNDFKLVLTALETLQNFVDCPEHSDKLIQCGVLSIIHDRIAFGVYKMKQAASKVLVNLFYYTPNENFLLLVKYETQFDILYFYKLLADVLSETDNTDILYFGLLGFLNFLTRITEFGVDITEIFYSSGLFEILPQLKDQITNEKVSQANQLLMSYIKENVRV